MLILSRRDLESLLKPEELRKVMDHLQEKGSEVLLFVCSTDSLYLGCLILDEGKIVDFDRFLPSVTYRNLYHDLPDQEVLPCPMCAQDPSVIRMENNGFKVCVYSS